MTEFPSKHMPDLFDRWVKEYPNHHITTIMLSDIKKKLSHGSFTQSLVDGDLNEAYSHADPINLKALERLIGINKHQWGEYYWGWPHYPDCGCKEL